MFSDFKKGAGVGAPHVFALKEKFLVKETFYDLYIEKEKPSMLTDIWVNFGV